MTRLLLSCTAAALLAVPVLAQPAAAATTKKPVAHAAHATRHATPVVRRGNDPQGNAAVDALNAQSLTTARGGTAAPAAR